MDPTLAFVFPGQGSQSLGMLAELAAAHPAVRVAFDEASDGCGLDLWALSSAGPEERLNQTEFTQPALLAAGVAVWRAWVAAGGATPGRAGRPQPRRVRRAGRRRCAFACRRRAGWCANADG